MKKILLTMAVAVATCFGAAAATEITASDFTDTPGTTGEPKSVVKKDGFTVQVLQATGQTAPAYNRVDALRLYANNTLGVYGQKLTKIVFTIDAENNAKRYCKFQPSVGKIDPAQATGDTQITWVGDAANVIFTVEALGSLGTENTKPGQIHIKSIEITGVGGGEGPQEPEPAKEYVCKLVNEISDGEYSLCVPGQGAVRPVAQNKDYDYLFVVPTTFTDNSYTTSEANIFTFKHEVSGYTIKDSNNRYLGMDASHYSIQMYDNVDAEGANCYWLVSFAGNDAIIENTGRTNCKFYCTEYNSNWEIATGDRTIDGTTYFLPQLYKVDYAAGIQDVELNDADAPVEFFNLQGVRVAEPSNGLFIKRQGKTVTKVLVK